MSSRAAKANRDGLTHADDVSMEAAMATRQTAGGSAAQKAEKLRQSAERWERGAEGEQLTAAMLGPLAERGYRVFHDLSIPGSRANIDHLVIGPTGVFALDSKNLTTKLHMYNGDVWRGRYPYAGKLRATRWEADTAGEALGFTTVTAVQCIHGAAVPDLDEPLHGVWLVPAERLLALIESAPVTLTDDQCTVLAAKAVLAFAAAGQPDRPSRPQHRPPRPSRPSRPAPAPPVVVAAAETRPGFLTRFRQLWRT